MSARSADASIRHAPAQRRSSVTPKLLWASRQPSATFGQYIARSTTIPCVEVTTVETAAFARRGSTRFHVDRPPAVRLQRDRLRNRRRRPAAGRSASPRGRRVRIAQQHEAVEERPRRAFREEPARARHRSRPPTRDRRRRARSRPHREIHRALRDDRIRSTVMSSPNNRFTTLRHVAREHASGASARRTFSGDASPTPPPSSRNFTVTSAGAALSLASRTNVLKKPCEPSANNQRVAGAGRAGRHGRHSRARPSSSSVPPPAVAPSVERTIVDDRRVRQQRCRRAAAAACSPSRTFGSRAAAAALRQESMFTGAFVAPGLATVTSRSKNEPVAPSASEYVNSVTSTVPFHRHVEEARCSRREYVDALSPPLHRHVRVEPCP